MAPRMAVALLLLAGATGCWTDACETFDADLLLPVCTERLASLFNTAEYEPDTVSWCPGTVSPTTTCHALGYTESCQGAAVQPPDQLLPQCR